MRLAPDPITIVVDGVAITLRPTLRAAYRLNRDPGFQDLATGVLDGHLPLIARMIEEASGVVVTPEKLLHATLIDEMFLGALADALLAYMALLIGVGEKEANTETKPASIDTGKAKGITRAEFYDKLFGYGTGWLNWTPAETWAASPAEIMAAYEGRIDLLKSIFGDGGESDKQARQQIPLSERAKAVMQSLGGVVVKRPKKGGA